MKETRREPDFVYDPSEWESTFEWPDRNILTDGLWDGDEPWKFATLYKGPDKWVVNIDGDMRWFDSEEEAKAAMLHAREGSAEGEG